MTKRPQSGWHLAAINLVLWSMLAVVGVSSCGHSGRPGDATTATGRGTPAWLTHLHRGHLLVGKIWSVKRRAFVAETDVIRDATRARFVLLGEKHDNPDHHRLQAHVLTGMVAAGRHPAVAFEMFETTDQEAIDRYRQDPAHDAAGLGTVVDWPTKSWPAWSEYQPIAEVIFRNRLSVVAANLPHAEVRALVRGEAAAADRARLGSLGVDHPLPPEAERSLMGELRASHCGHLPERMLPGMLLGQRSRDAQMAESLRSHAARDGAVLIAGSGHVRIDRGVPWYLHRSSGDVGVLSVAFVEVDPTTLDPAPYATARGAAAPTFDYLWFTPRANDDDPCAAFARPRSARQSEGARHPGQT